MACDESRKALEAPVGILFKFACVPASFNGMLDKRKLLNGFSNILNTQGYPLNVKLNVIRVISNMSRQKNKEEVLTFLLEAEDERFMRNFGKLLLQNHVTPRVAH